MKKSVVILLLIIQLFLLIIFHNIYSLFKGFEGMEITEISNRSKIMDNIKRIKEIFLSLSLALGVFFIITSFYLIYMFKKSKSEEKVKTIPPLQNYLKELKDSELELKDIAAKQEAYAYEKEELNKSIINNINSAIIFLNNSERIDIFNSIAEILFLQSYANAKNNTLNIILSKFPEIIDFVKKNKGGKVYSEIISNKKVFFVDIIPIKNIGKLIMIKDVTEEKKREEINRMNKNFIMLGEMTTFLTHEIRNSLGVIYGYTKTIKSESEKMDKVNKEINFLSSMMETFLNFSKPVNIDRKEKIELADLFKKISLEKEIEINLINEDIVIKNDETLIKSVFLNLVLNSKEAGANKIDIEFKKNKNIELIFKDNGRGFDMKIKDNIWYPFFSTKKKGTGMGLAIVKKIIISLNGEISLISSDKNGTSFKIVFYS